MWGRKKFAVEILGRSQKNAFSEGWIVDLTGIEYLVLERLARVLRDPPKGGEPSVGRLMAEGEYWQETFLFIKNLADAIENSKEGLPKTEGKGRAITISRVMDVTIGGKG